MLPLGDQNTWYYPSQGHESDDDLLSVGVNGGNWGKKSVKGARWVRRGKMTAWGPGMEDWEADERARKRIKLLLPPERHSPPPPSLPHLRSPSPPLVSPYPPPTTHHLSYSSFVMDKAVTHSFRSSLLDELEQATNGLIEGESTLRRALGRLWQAISDSPHGTSENNSLVPKREDQEGGDEQDEREQRLARGPDLTPSTHRLFLSTHTNGPPVFDPSQFVSPELQLETLEKSLATLRELQDDGREYVERLTEIREGLGDAKAQRNMIWDKVREKAVESLKEEVYLGGS